MVLDMLTSILVPIPATDPFLGGLFHRDAAGLVFRKLSAIQPRAKTRFTHDCYLHEQGFERQELLSLLIRSRVFGAGNYAALPSYPKNCIDPAEVKSDRRLGLLVRSQNEQRANDAVDWTGHHAVLRCG